MVRAILVHKFQKFKKIKKAFTQQAPDARSCAHVLYYLIPTSTHTTMTSLRGHFKQVINHKNCKLLTKSSMVSLVVTSKFVCELSDLKFLRSSRKPSSNQKSELASTINLFMPPTFSMSDMILITTMQLFASAELFAS
jgi:hypothetical protein